MFVDDIPTELSTLEKLEQILIAQRIVFEKKVFMPKGQQRKIKGAICNVPVECDKTFQTLLRAPESSGIILLKLKCKLRFRGHVYYQAVCPEIVLNALNVRPWQTRTHCCRHKCFSVCPSYGPQKICVWDTKMFDFVQKHLCPQQMFPSLRSPLVISVRKEKQQTVTNNSLFNTLTSINSNAVHYISFERAQDVLSEKNSLIVWKVI